MNTILRIPEVAAINAPDGLLRIPDQVDVPLTSRIKRVIDCPGFRRLGRISQLGLVSQVYPGATHSRFEHSLGVYRMALLFLRQLSSRREFTEIVDEEQATAFILAALLHDIGHYPFCHPIEDLGSKSFPEHESLASRYIAGPESMIGAVIREEFQIEPERVVRLIERRKENEAERLLCSMLSGPIDVDKMDYLYRDSLHAGVPYGRNFDAPRLISSLCLNRSRDRLAITDKGRTAAELLVFARYVMFSEVYWHHAVRSATAMFQRAVFEMIDKPEHACDSALYSCSESEFSRHLLNLVESENDDCRPLIEGIFGSQRKLYKRLASYSCLENEEVYRLLARRPYPWLVQCSNQLARLLSALTGLEIGATSVLIDAPPVGLEVQFDVDVYYKRTESFRPLGEVSPVVNTLARKQFDDLVKQVRVFVDPEFTPALRDEDVTEAVREAVALTVTSTASGSN